MTYLWQKDVYTIDELADIANSPTTYNLEALTALGRLYALGLYNYPQSSDQATLILNMAMSKKHAQAFYVYALLVDQDFFKGKQDHTKSVAYLKKSSELGFDLAMTKLGEYYLIGKGVKKSYRDAEKWLSKARNAASIPGLKVLVEIYKELQYFDKVLELEKLIDSFINIKPYNI